MKRIILLLLMFFSLNFVKAEETFYRAQYFAYKCVENNQWTNWSVWQESKVLVSVDFKAEVIQIYTELPQKYIILDTGDEYEDNKGGTQVEFSVIDQDKDIGIIRFRIQSDGTVQLYVEFNDIMWVYSGLYKI